MVRVSVEVENSAYVSETNRTQDFYELVNDLLDESERALEEHDIAWCAVVHNFLLPAIARETKAGPAFSHARVPMNIGHLAEVFGPPGRCLARTGG